MRRLEALKVGMVEGQKVGRLESSSNERVLSFPKVIIPDRAERRRREVNIGRLEDRKVQVMKGFCPFPKS